MKIPTKTKVRVEPYLSMNGVIRYMAANDANQRRKILLGFKYPAPQGEAMGLYYNPARDAIREYHTSGNEAAVFRQHLDYLEGLLLKVSDEKATKLENNIRAIRAYQANFGDRKFEPLPHQQTTVYWEGVQLNLRADMIATERKRNRVIRYAFSKNGAEKAELRYSSQMMHFYARSIDLAVTNADCLLLVVAEGEAIVSPGVMGSFTSQLTGAMREVKDLWPNL